MSTIERVCVHMFIVVMGVKGRRVAVVEELSNTVISFQKVASGQKDRGLTITGNTEEVIEHARLLIEETIRRNVSPNRVRSRRLYGTLALSTARRCHCRS